MNTFGDRLRRLRTAAGMTQEQLGFRVGVTKATISAWENNHDVPSHKALRLLLNEMEWSLDNLLREVDPKSSLSKRPTPEVKEPAASYSTGKDAPRAQDPREYAMLMRFRSLPLKKQIAILDLLSEKMGRTKQKANNNSN